MRLKFAPNCAAGQARQWMRRAKLDQEIWRAFSGGPACTADLPETNSAQRLPIIMAGAFVFPALMFGMAERSQTRKFSTPRTRSLASSTAIGSLLGPIRQVPAGW
jgi:hypothetical protein